MREFQVSNGMARSVFDSKYSRRKPDGTMQSYAERISEVVTGNFMLDPRVGTDEFPMHEYERTKELAVAGVIPTAGRHLQHGDRQQPEKILELFTNCSTAMFSFMLFRLLLRGSGVGRDYSAECCRVDWSMMPDIRMVMDESHKDFDYNEFRGSFEPLRDARHKYDSSSEKVRWFTVDDSREGWAKTVEILETAAWQGKHSDKLFIFDFSNVRPAGTPIMGLQGRPASGPLSVMRALAQIYSIKHAGMKPWKQALFIDHYIAACVQFGGARRCLPVGTIVTTTRGGIPIEDVRVDDTIITAKGRATVTEVFEQGLQPTINIVHQFGKFECTPSHEMAVFDGLSSWIFKRADMLLPGDRLVYDPIGWEYPGSTALPDYTPEGPRRPETGAGGDTNSVVITIPELTPDVAWLLGFIHGNGYVGEKSLGLSSNAALDYGPRILSKATQILTLFGLPLTEPKIVKDENTLVVRVFSVHLVRYLSKWLKTSKTEVRVPDCVKFGDFEIRAAYLAGLFDADGSNNRPLQLVITVYEEFAREIQQLYLSLGVLTQKTGGTRRTAETWQPLYQVSTKGFENIEKINALFENQSIKLDYQIGPSRDGFTFPTAMVRRELKGHWITANENQTTARIQANLGRNFIGLPVQVLALEPGRVVSTYDIEVEKLHQFTANGFVTHNSARMSVKHWRDRDVIDFIDIKRGGFLWSSNNSVLVDEEFWQAARKPQPSHARRVFEAAVAASYWDATGEPGFINVDKMNTNLDGLNMITAKNYINPETYPDLHPRTIDMIDNVLGHVKKLRYPFLTNPCGEIVLSTFGGYCQIGDICLAYVETLEEAEEAVGLLTKFLVRTSLMKCDYAAEVKRTNRIGVAITGVHEFAWKMFGLTFLEMIDYNYTMDHKAHGFWTFINNLRLTAEAYAASYSIQLGLVVPHTVTTVKPSGTISKVMSCTEGVHLPALKHYLRWVQYKYNDPDLDALKQRGYPVKDVSHRYPEYWVVGFPTKQPLVDLMGAENVITADETTPEQNFKWLQLLEYHWLGGDKNNNQVSYTLKYDSKKISYTEFMELILEYQPHVRCCSVMPQSDWEESERIYAYVPEQPISEAEYNELMDRINPVSHEGYDTDALDCEGGACPVEMDMRHMSVAGEASDQTT